MKYHRKNYAGEGLFVHTDATRVQIGKSKFVYCIINDNSELENAISGIVVGFLSGFTLSPLQKDTLKILAIVCACAAAYCFIVGEISRNTSQMDKLWSLLPEIYIWIVAICGSLTPRLLVMAILATLWGIRLTTNFALKGAYSWKFWSGVEDYRWAVLRKNSILKNPFLWALFDLFFISLYQNALVLAITLPSVAVMESDASFHAMDYVATFAMVFFLLYETLADIQQWKFHTKKHALLAEGKKPEELEMPYRLGFNTIGLWGHSRHPNYLGEQMIWVSFYLFTIGANVTHWGVFHWSIAGCLLLILLFVGSSNFGEKISSGKYPLYSDYILHTPKYLLGKKYTSKAGNYS